jgi:ESX secretion system protein EccE
MTEPPGSVRATARVGAPASRRRGIATLEPHRRPGYLGPVHVLQIALVEGVVIGIAAALAHSSVAAAAVGAAGALLLALTLGRRHGRWWLEHQAMARRMRRRATVPGPATGGDARLEALRLLAPGIAVDTVSGTDGTHIGVARDSAGWFAAAEVATALGVRATARPPVPLDVLATALADADQSGGAVVQVVTHTIPAAVDDDEAGRSYRELLQRYGPVQVPVDRTTWIAVRLDTVALAEVGADLPDRAPDLVAALLRQLTKSLRRNGVTTHPLDRDGLLDALDRSCDLTARLGAGYDIREVRPTPAHEDWRGWHSGRLGHRTFWLRHWPSIAQAGALLDWLATTPAAYTSVALILAPTGGEVDIRCLARISARPDRLTAAVDTLRAGARTANVDLFALDGEQRPAVYATAPTGGGPR